MPTRLLHSGTKIAASGPCHQLCLASDRSAYGWGYNGYAQADGSGHLRSSSFRFAPAEVLGLVGGEVASLAAGGGHSAAILRTDALVWLAEAAIASQLREHLLAGPAAREEMRLVANRVAGARGAPHRLVRLANALVAP